MTRDRPDAAAGALVLEPGQAIRRSSRATRWTCCRWTRPLLPCARHARPVWLAAATLPGGRLRRVAVADDRMGPRGEAALLPSAGLGPSSSPVAPLLELGHRQLRPAGARLPARRRRDARRRGRRLAAPASCWPGRSRRPGCSGTLPAGARVDWRARARGAPGSAGAVRGMGRPGGADGGRGAASGWWTATCPRQAFPLSRRAGLARPPGRRRCAAGFLGIVSAQTGRRPHLPSARQRRARRRLGRASPQGVVEPASAHSRGACWRGGAYPVELFRVQARQLERRQRKLGSAGRPHRRRRRRTLPRTDVAWADDTDRVPASRSRTSGRPSAG